MRMMKNTSSGQQSAVGHPPPPQSRGGPRHHRRIPCHSSVGRVVASSLLIFAFVPLCVFLLAGCQQLGAFAAVWKEGETLPAEYKLGPGALAVVLDDPEQLGVPTDAMRAFHDKLKQEFEDRKVNKQVVAFADLQKLRQNEEQFDKLSVRQIGEKL